MATNNVITGEDSRPTIRSFYCYAIRNLDSDESFYLTNAETSIVITGLPASWNAEEPQEFASAQVGHGRIERRDGIDKVSFDIQAQLSRVAGLSRYTLFGAIPRIQVDVIRISPGPVLNQQAAIWGLDTLIVQSGIIELFGTEGFSMTARCTPEAFITGHQVPRWRCTRTCNRQLYAEDCTVDRELHKMVGNIVSTDYAARTLVMSEQLAPDKAENYFRMGVLVHEPSQTRHSIFQSAYSGPDHTRIWLQQWFPDMEVGDVVTVFAGCSHTMDHCQNKFNNLANFGEFPLVPNKNPSMHGV